VSHRDTISVLYFLFYSSTLQTNGLQRKNSYFFSDDIKVYLKIDDYRRPVLQLFSLSLIYYFFSWIERLGLGFNINKYHVKTTWNSLSNIISSPTSILTMILLSHKFSCTRILVPSPHTLMLKILTLPSPKF